MSGPVTSRIGSPGKKTVPSGMARSFTSGLIFLRYARKSPENRPVDRRYSTSSSAKRNSRRYESISARPAMMKKPQLSGRRLMETSKQALSFIYLTR